MKEDIERYKKLIETRLKKIQTLFGYIENNILRLSEEIVNYKDKNENKQNNRK